jgi:diadenosine tetraphosphatase ApaH/serine/threonine PP2A family protein phosphatase
VKLVREYASAAVVGNHEVMFLAILREGPSDRETTNGLWKSLALGRKGLTAADTKWVRKLPLAAIARDMTFVHSSLHHPHKFDDIYNIESARLNFDAQETPISFHGHTHIPLVWEEKDGEVTGYRPGEGRIQLDRTHRYAVGVGSVGQPRDHDPRASYALYEPESHRLSIRRLEYDIERA